MNALDVVITVAAVAAATGGWRQGIVVRLCIAGFSLAGVLLAARNVGWITSKIAPLGENPGTFGVIVALAIGLVSGRIIGTLIGRWVRHRLPTRPIQTLDHVAGAAAGLIGVVTAVWLSGPFLGLIPGWPSSQWQSSRIALAVSSSLPTPPNPLGNARFAIGLARFPQMFATAKQGAELFDAAGGLGPIVSAVSNPNEVPGQAALIHEASEVTSSNVMVSSVACRVKVRGAGVVVLVPAIGAEPLVLTTAQQVAGATDITVDDGRSVRKAVVVAFDPSENLALIRTVTLLEATPVAVATVASPGKFSVAGRNVDLLGSKNAQGRDIYGKTSVNRDVVLLRGTVTTSDLGAGLLDEAGRLHGIVIGLVPTREGAAVALRAARVRAFLAAAPSLENTSRCVTK